MHEIIPSTVFYEILFNQKKLKQICLINVKKKRKRKMFNKIIDVSF